MNSSPDEEPLYFAAHLGRRRAFAAVIQRYQLDQLQQARSTPQPIPQSETSPPVNDIEFVAAPIAELQQVAAAEVQAFRWVNGEPRQADIPHLMARVRVLIEPGLTDRAIEDAIKAAQSGVSK